MFKITFNLLENEDEYSFLKKQYNLDGISVSNFANFLRFQCDNDTFVFDLLSKCLISAKQSFLSLYKQELGIRNITNLDKSVDQAFKNNIFSF